MPRIERQDEYSERIDDTDVGGDSSWQAAPVTTVCIWTAGAHAVSRVVGKDVKPSIHVEQNPVEMPATRAPELRYWAGPSVVRHWGKL